MFKNCKLNEWMKYMLVYPVEGMDKYYIDQPLTEGQATEIMFMLAKATECDLNSVIARKNQLRRGDPYRTFLECYTNLLVAGDTKAWRNKLWDALADIDKTLLKNYMKQLFNVDIGMLL